MGAQLVNVYFFSRSLSAGGEQQHHLRRSGRAGDEVPQPELPQPLWKQDQGPGRPGSLGKTATHRITEPTSERLTLGVAQLPFRPGVGKLRPVALGIYINNSPITH